MNNGKDRLYAAAMIRKLRYAGVAMLVLILAAELFISMHAYFPFADWFAFNAVCGLLSAFVLVAVARLLASVIRRRDDYYD